MKPDTQAAGAGQHWRQVCRCTKLLSGVGIFTFIVAQFAYGLSLHNPWQRIVGSTGDSNLTWQAHFGRNMFRAAGPHADGISDLFNVHKSKVRLENCSLIPANLSGAINVTMIPHNWTEIIDENNDVKPGGLWRPRDCIARHHVAIIVPYRNRDRHLRIFIRHMHTFLQRQQLDYGIYIVDEALPTRFNRAMLMNIGYAEASKQANYSCYIFHDVDLVPEDDRNIYGCPEQPRHMSAAIDKFDYKLPYHGLFGGVSAFKKEHFNLINGFSNKFFGWGGEDDDLYERTRFHNLKLTRYSMAIARYKMIKHKNEPLNRPNPKRMTLLYGGKKRFKTDGLNSLKYERLDLQKRPLYTLINVKLIE